MNATSFLAVLGGLLALAFVANRLFRLTRVPGVIVLLAVGLRLGPVLRWLQPAGSQVVRIPGLQARPLAGGTSIGTGNLLAFKPSWPAGRRVLPHLLP